MYCSSHFAVPPQNKQKSLNIQWNEESNEAWTTKNIITSNFPEQKKMKQSGTFKMALKEKEKNVSQELI